MGEGVTAAEPFSVFSKLATKHVTGRDPDAHIEAWPALPETIRVGILAMIESISRGKSLYYGIKRPPGRPRDPTPPTERRCATSNSAVLA